MRNKTLLDKLNILRHAVNFESIDEVNGIIDECIQMTEEAIAEFKEIVRLNECVGAKPEDFAPEAKIAIRALRGVNGEFNLGVK